MRSYKEYDDSSPFLNENLIRSTKWAKNTYFHGRRNSSVKNKYYRIPEAPEW